jgi:hypothetical protein
MGPKRPITAVGCSAAAAALAIVMAVIACSQAQAARDDAYPTMAKLSEYLISTRSEEIDLAKSAAPTSVADHAGVLVLGPHGYESVVKGTNGFVCLVGRSWDLTFTDPQFWNPKIRTPQCDNAVAARTVRPRYLTRTEWVLAGVSRDDMQKRETAAWAAGTLTAPEPGAMCYMLSKRGYINDTAGRWHPHVMYFTPRTDAAAWGANLPGSPVAADSTSYAHTTIFFVIVPNWSDGTPAPLHQ